MDPIHGHAKGECRMKEPVIICRVVDSRSKAVVPEHLLADKSEAQVERFFRRLLMAKPEQRLEIRRAA